MEKAKQDASVVNEVKVAYVQNKIESLWEMEEPHIHDNLPPFHSRNVTICTKSVCFGKDQIVQRTTNVRPFRQRCHFGDD